jgi:hypothetical protein
MSCQNEYCTDYRDEATGDCLVCAADGPPCKRGTRGQLRDGDADDCGCERCAEAAYDRAHK